MRENIAIGEELGYLRVPDNTLADLQEGTRLPEDEILLLCTGSQGEPMAALSRLALGKLKEFHVERETP